MNSNTLSIYISENGGNLRHFENGNKTALVRIVGGIQKGLRLAGYERNFAVSGIGLPLQMVKGEDRVTIYILTYKEFQESDL